MSKQTTARKYTYQDAQARVSEDPELVYFDGIIFYDWPNEAEHYEWICTAPKAEIISWAREIEKAGK